jgi:hypothetical protein
MHDAGSALQIVTDYKNEALFSSWRRLGRRYIIRGEAGPARRMQGLGLRVHGGSGLQHGCVFGQPADDAKHPRFAPATGLKGSDQEIGAAAQG